ncbi:hypothetical protein QOZ80_7AG0576390 [Eleusine coracana subsp. coracana]|nr:hypothetical protein QOZ80_7AG0576390 [Eleusine coracana subsp. coracana]
MAQEEREVQVRALDGRSTAVRLAAGASVRDLKAALRISFVPAQVSPSFHLFLKGAKLRLDAQIGSLDIREEDFIVLVPFTKASQHCSSTRMQSQDQGINTSKAPEASAAADSAWKDIMDDLSSIPPSPQSDAAYKDFSSSVSFPDDLMTFHGSYGSSRKRRKTCKEDGNVSPETLSSTVNGTSEKRNMSKKSGVFKSPASSCHCMQPLEPAEMVEHLKQGLGKEGQIVHVEEIPSREASFVELPCHLSEAMRQALNSIGISRLYSHQSQSIESSISGKHVVIATSTSSGKSLCYNIPVLESLSGDSMACALYIFPTKALAQDQLRTLLEMNNAFHIDIDVKIYDGDTPKEDRLWIRNNARLFITNPDMLHVSILPYHGQFQRILSNLRYIVTDEAHSYKGAFGCHTALIIRRLKRICSNIYGCHPTFIFCTATSANPREHVMELANLDDVELIENDGSPCGSKYFLMWNPPLHTEKEGSSKGSPVTRRSSPIVEVSYLFSEMVRHGLRCIAFCKTRKLCELVLAYTREILQETAKELVDSISVYRAGYIAEKKN